MLRHCLLVAFLSALQASSQHAYGHGLQNWLLVERNMSRHFDAAMAACRSLRADVSQRSGVPPPNVIQAQHRLQAVLQTIPKTIQRAPSQQTFRKYLLPMWPYRFKEVEGGCYSQNGEDGIILWIFALIGTTNKAAVEVCSGVGYENNVANLALFHGWRTMQVDGSLQNAQVAMKFYTQQGMPTGSVKPIFKQAFVTAENINSLIDEAGFKGAIDLLSLDMDGMDWYVLQNISVVHARVIIVEVQDIFGWNVSRARPYAANFVAASHAYTESIGVSLGAYLKLLGEAYRLVGCIKEGFNAMFIHRSINHPLLPEVHPASCFAMLEDDMQLRLRYSERLRTALQFPWVDPS